MVTNRKDHDAPTFDPMASSISVMAFMAYASFSPSILGILDGTSYDAQLAAVAVICIQRFFKNASDVLSTYFNYPYGQSPSAIQIRESWLAFLGSFESPKLPALVAIWKEQANTTCRNSQGWTEYEKKCRKFATDFRNLVQQGLFGNQAITIDQISVAFMLGGLPLEAMPAIATLVNDGQSFPSFEEVIKKVKAYMAQLQGASAPLALTAAMVEDKKDKRIEELEVKLEMALAASNSKTCFKCNEPWSKEHVCNPKDLELVQLKKQVTELLRRGQGGGRGGRHFNGGGRGGQRSGYFAASPTALLTLPGGFVSVTDSGASFVQVGDPSHLDPKYPIEAVEVPIEVAGGGIIKATHRGTFSLLIKGDPFHFHGALVVPGAVSLMSVGAWVDADWRRQGPRA